MDKLLTFYYINIVSQEKYKIKYSTYYILSGSFPLIAILQVKNGQKDIFRLSVSHLFVQLCERKKHNSDLGQNDYYLGQNDSDLSIIVLYQGQQHAGIVREEGFYLGQHYYDLCKNGPDLCWRLTDSGKNLADLGHSHAEKSQNDGFQYKIRKGVFTVKG